MQRVYMTSGKVLTGESLTKAIRAAYPDYLNISRYEAADLGGSVMGRDENGRICTLDRIRTVETYSDMTEQEINRRIDEMRDFAENNFAACMSKIGDNSDYVAETLAFQMFEDNPHPSNVFELIDWFMDIESQCDFFTDNRVYSQDWSDELAEHEVWGLLENNSSEIDDYISDTAFSKRDGETFIEMIVRGVRWWHDSVVASGSVMACESIRDRLSEVVCQLEDDYADHEGDGPDSVT